MEYLIGQANRLGNRDNNQDRFTAIESNEGVLLALGDGMGGRSGGEEAAGILVETARTAYLHARRPLSDPDKFLRQVILDSHQRILEQASNPLFPPGTTAVLCLIEDQTAHWAHVGDSRLYVFRQGLPLYRTRDHSYVEELYSLGLISLEEREKHPDRSRLTQCVGYQRQAPDVELGKPTPLQAGDVILLCTDGLWTAIDDAEIGSELAGNDFDSALDSLACRAESNRYPHSDNVTVLALRLLRNRGKALPQDGGAPADSLQHAIEQIEEVYRKYRDEFSRD